MSLNFKIPISFEACFPGEAPKDLKAYLKGADKATLLKIGSFFLGFKIQNSKYSNLISFLDMFFSDENQDFKAEIIKNLGVYISEGNRTSDDYEIPYVISSLSFFEFVYDNIDEKQTQTLSYPEIEQNVFKAYLLLTQINTVERGKLLEKNIKDNKLVLSAAEILLVNQLHNYDVTNYRIDKTFTCQFLKSIYFFEFLEGREDTSELLKSFYNFYGVKDYKDYLKRLFGLLYPVLMADLESHTEILIENKEDIEFVDKHIVNPDETITDIDFVKTRSNPLYKYEEGKYRIIYPLFILEMTFNGLYFRLKEINDKLDPAVKVKDLYNLKTYAFSEQQVLNSILREIYKNKYVQKSGVELDAIMDGAPDYYMRNGKKVFLYESKDILINREVKQSVDFNQISNELKVKLVENDKGKPKAVKQLINNIKQILTGKAAFDPRIPIGKVEIYPVLVVHNRIFEVVGLNKKINSWFQEELEKLTKEGIDISRVHNLIILDIDTFIFNKQFFIDNKFSLEECIEGYEKNCLNLDLKKKNVKTQEQAERLIQDSFLPFSYFLEKKIESKYVRNGPKEILNKGYELFDEDDNSVKA